MTTQRSPGVSDAMASIDPNQALADAENALRDFIADTLSEKLAADWLASCGVTPDRIAIWKERKEIEEKKHGDGVDERPLYYADFYDLRTILKKNWNGPFAEAFGERKTFEALLEQLEDLRNPVAHRRELLPHQKHLALGISGEIRSLITRYRSKRDRIDDAFPRIEFARDSLGHTSTAKIKTVHTGAVLRPGDVVDYVVTATDPEGTPLQYAMFLKHDFVEPRWQDENMLSLHVTEQYVGKRFGVVLMMRASARQYHASGGYDDWVEFVYSVLPPRRRPSAYGR
jgi:hypothetical protein